MTAGTFGSRNRAFTLVELCIVMTAVALIASVATTLLHAMMRQQATGEKQLLVGSSLMRLSLRFRSDVQSAVEARIEEPGRITLTKPGPVTVSYVQTDVGTIRRVTEEDGVARQDEFTLQGLPRVSFSVERFADSPEMVILKVQFAVADPRADSDVSPEDPRYVIANRGSTMIAELARDHRWARGQP